MFLPLGVQDAVATYIYIYIEGEIYNSLVITEAM